MSTVCQRYLKCITLAIFWKSFVLGSKSPRFTSSSSDVLVFYGAGMSDNAYKNVLTVFVKKSQTSNRWAEDQNKDDRKMRLC